MFKTKNLLSMILATVMVFSMSATAMAAPIESYDLRVASEATITNVDNLASIHLSSMKSQFASNPSLIGFSSSELSDSSLGNAFTLYVFNENGQVISDDTQVYPVIYANQIVGILEVYCDSITSEYAYTFGKSYAEKLNNLRYVSNIDTSNNLIIGRIANKLFITDSNEVDIILDKTVDSTATISIANLKNICTNLHQNVSSDYTTISESAIHSTTLQSKISARALPNPLPVPHVAQTGVCGVAAWAAVLNYRFNEDYNNATLAEAMAADYTNGIPHMGDYRDYANDMHDAGCTLAYSPLSFTKMKRTINGGRPIIGSWYSGSGSDKSWHAIIITGYVENSSSNYTYVVKNPWHKDTQTITVTSSNSVVYPDSGYTWKLSQCVY
ncbi:MAG: hypothetical protein MJB12_02070 [Firmicutes bacterium]|nr:hypothetical protein [Bacillota bacterium]